VLRERHQEIPGVGPSANDTNPLGFYSSAVVPVEPPPSPWDFPPAASADEYGVVAVGADLEPGTLLAGYRRGIFPMPIDQSREIGWWSPDPRGVLELDDLRVSRSLRRSMQRYHVSTDICFRDVAEACADPGREGGWITGPMLDAYDRLHQLGWAHSVEVWDESGHLVGGLYGLSIGGLFCGESMFHRSTDASKVALVVLVDRLRSGGASLVDVQWQTDHLSTLGVSAIGRSAYVERVAELTAPQHSQTWEPRVQTEERG